MELKIKMMLAIFLLLQMVIQTQAANSTVLLCHYSCANCTTTDYYECTVCNINRGNNGTPIYGMCYCSESQDEDSSGVCQPSMAYNYTNKALIVVFIGLTLFFSIAIMIIKGMKYFLFKTIQDVQELSLIVFINLYFPQQFDIFLTSLYRFNISSYTFENAATGTLFQVQTDSSLTSVDGQNIFGKYKLLVKTANFFSNQFTWIVVAFCILVVAIIIKLVRNWLKKKQQYKLIRREIKKEQVSQHDTNNEIDDFMSQEVVQFQKQKVNDGDKITPYSVFNKLYNILWLNFLIAFLYFSVIEININIFTQIANLTFSSPFATTGAFFSAVFLAFQLVLMVLLFLKAKEEMIKPQWMRDYAYTPTMYLVRTNYKTITKYFWFISVVKKILLAMMITLLYDDPLSSIIGVSTVHAVYLCLAIYCEPFERKYIRVHFYLTEAMKMFMFLSLIDFTTKYVEFIQLINLTQIFYTMIAFIFGCHLFFLLLNIIFERQVYLHFIKKMCCKEDYQHTQSITRIGYRSNQKLYIYVKE